MSPLPILGDSDGRRPTSSDFSFFCARTLIEDTATSHQLFARGLGSNFVPTRTGQSPLMSGIRKTSSNFLEGMHRWDMGSIQLLGAMSSPSCSFWKVLFVLLLLQAGMLAPCLMPKVRGTPPPRAVRT